ncbi:unnamed protein product [Brugia pahangi]|uniref:Ovule protein n=1 Tax=Brugia pahangi TaxID=6280 RepID=A0A0N4TB07_BRUPA|nr:unnamed protein product [Brugia pahangi]
MSGLLLSSSHPLNEYSKLIKFLANIWVVSELLLASRFTKCFCNGSLCFDMLQSDCFRGIRQAITFS